MGSSLVGSTNQAEAFSADMEGQIITLNGDATSQASGLVITSANGTGYKLSVANDGTLSGEAV